MADNILKLRVESSEYDQKLANAAKGIRHLAEVAHQSGGELTGLEKAELDYVKALGEMETKSRTAAGGVRELESSYKELKVIYDQLNEVEKADEGGKALAASLEQIKQRAQDAKTQLEQASQSLQDNANAGKESGGILDSLAQKFTINIDALKLFDLGLKAAGVALDVAKDSFFSSETNIDDWGRTVQSAESVYQSFLVSLNTGDFSGFLSRIGQVTQAAKDAYDALDELGTRMTIINPERARLQARQQELRAVIRRNGADSEVGKAALQELKKIEPLLSKSFQTESKMNYNAFESLVKQRLAEGGINLNQKSFQQFMKTFSNDAAFQNLRRNARGSSELRETSEIGKFRTVDTRNIEQKLLDLFTDEWRQANSGYLAAAFNARGAAASNALGNARYMKAGGSKGGNGGKDTKTEQTPDQIIREQFAAQQRDSLAYSSSYKSTAVDQPSDAWRAFTESQTQVSKSIEDALQALNKKEGISPKGRPKDTQNVSGTEQFKKTMGDISQLTGGVTSIVSGIQQLGVEIPEEMSKVLGAINVISGILTTIASLATIMTATSTAKATPLIGWLLAGGGIVHAAGGYSVPGNHYSGDNVPALLNSGELVLNRAQQFNLASQLQGGGMQGLNLTATIRGEQIRLALNNNGRRTGRGEYVQSNKR